MVDIEEIDHYAKQAHKLVDYVIESAIRKLETLATAGEEGLARERSAVRFDISRDTTIVLPERTEDYEIRNIDWLTIAEFSAERAEEKIHEFVKTWEYEDSWLYCVDYIGCDDLQYDTRHRFRVRWSIPTRRKPVPRATASVYFTFDVSKIKPGDFPVEVYYVFESNRSVHRPGQSRFRQKWLKNIIESKVKLMEVTEF